MGFTPEEQEIFCTGLQDGSMQKAVDNALDEQRKAGWLVFAFFSLAALYFNWKGNAAVAARDLGSRINKSNTENGISQKPTAPTNTTTAT